MVRNQALEALGLGSAAVAVDASPLEIGGHLRVPVFASDDTIASRLLVLALRSVLLTAAPEQCT